MTDRNVRLGVFYDGGWFGRLWRHMDENSAWKAGLSFTGVHDILRWYVHRDLGHPLTAVSLAEAHYVLGRPPELTHPGADDGRWIPRASTQEWDRVLQEEGIVRHDAVLSARKDARRQMGADVTLALVTFDRAITAALDMVVLVAPDAHLVPLVRYLQQREVKVIVPSICDESTNPDGSIGQISTEPALTEQADYAPTWNNLLASGLTEEYRLTYPFVSKVGGGSNVGGRPAADGYRYGTINNWNPAAGFGFITGNDGTKWFIAAQDLPPGYNSLPKGQPVRFNGRPHPTPGQKYPQARACQPLEAGHTH
ncbi:NYN domain-containing protein [Nonomuraea antimicrobica]